MQIKIILPLSLTLLMVACGDKTQSTAQFDKETFETYLKVKRIPLNDETRYQRMQAEYLRRQALTSAIEKTDKLDEKTIAVEVEEFRKELIISRYFDDYLRQSVTDESLQNYYRSNPDQFKSTRAGVAHILFRVNPRMTEAERQAKLTSARDVHGKLILGETFENLAKSFSEDKVSAAKGGSLGLIKQGAISKEFSAKVFALKEGEYTEPFLTEYGFHIAKLVSSPADVTQSFDAKKGDIRYQLRNQTKQAENKRLLDSVGYEPKS